MPQLEPTAPAGDLLKEFEVACYVDWRLREATVRERLRHARRLQEFLRERGKTLQEATKEDLRAFLQQDPAHNAVKTVRVLYGRFLGRPELVVGFRVPSSPPRFYTLPTRAQLRRVYRLLNPHRRAAFLLMLLCGMRLGEVAGLRWEQVDLRHRLIRPDPSRFTPTKRQWWVPFSPQVRRALERLPRTGEPGERVFPYSKNSLTLSIRRASKRAGVKVSPQLLRVWFCAEMARLGVPDRYVDAFCGRIPRGVLSRFYSDFSPARLKEIYDAAGIRL